MEHPYIDTNRTICENKASLYYSKQAISQAVYKIIGMARNSQAKTR
jgi:hypothetical protein